MKRRARAWVEHDPALRRVVLDPAVTAAVQHPAEASAGVKRLARLRKARREYNIAARRGSVAPPPNACRALREALDLGLPASLAGKARAFLAR